MSTSLAPIDLTGAVIGTTVTLDFNQFVKFNPARMSEKAHLGLFNESGCGLQCVMKASNDSQYLPAGGWTTFEVESNDSQMLATVTYILPNPPVSQLNAVYYAPGEGIPDSYTLGNSPIGIGGTVQTSSVQTLSNEGNPINTLVYDAGPAGNQNAMQLFNDHFIWKVIQSSVLHQVLAGNTAGHALQLGQAGDVSEVLGALKVDQNIGINTDINPTTALLLDPGADSNHGLTIFAHSVTQTANLLSIQDSLFNNLFTIAPSGDINAIGSASTVNGTAGSYTKCFPIWGLGLKIALISFNGYINNVSTDVIFPSTIFRHCCLPLVTAFTGLTFTFKNGVTSLGGRVMTGLGTGTGAGTDGSVTTFFPLSIIFTNNATAADRLTIGTSTTAVQGIVVIIGV